MFVVAVGYDPNITIGAIAVFIPAMLTVWLQLRTQRSLKTNHGKTIGEHVEKLVDDLKKHGADLNDLHRAFDRHVDQDEANFASIEKALADAADDRTKVKDSLQRLTDG